jgi:hypothetical protein
MKTAGHGVFLIPSKVLDAGRRGATTEPYAVIRRKDERSKATPPFDFAQDRESFDPAQDREPVERPAERPVERQMIPCWGSGPPFSIALPFLYVIFLNCCAAHTVRERISFWLALMTIEKPTGWPVRSLQR